MGYNRVKTVPKKPQKVLQKVQICSITIIRCLLWPDIEWQDLVLHLARTFLKVPAFRGGGAWFNLPSRGVAPPAPTAPLPDDTFTFFWKSSGQTEDQILSLSNFKSFLWKRVILGGIHVLIILLIIWTFFFTSFDQFRSWNFFVPPIGLWPDVERQ